MSDDNNMINVRLDEAAIVAAVNESVAAGIAKGIGDWHLQQDIAAAATAAVKSANLVGLVAARLDGYMAAEADRVAADVVSACAPTIVQALRRAFAASVANVLVQVEHPGYIPDAERAMRLRAVTRRILGEPEPGAAAGVVPEGNGQS